MSVLGIDHNTEFLNIGQTGILEFKDVSGIALPEILKSRMAGLTEWSTEALKDVFTSIYNVKTFECLIADTPWMMSKLMGPDGPMTFPPAQTFFIRIELASGDKVFGLFRYVGCPIRVNINSGFFRKDWEEIPYKFFDLNHWTACTFREISIYVSETESQIIQQYVKKRHQISNRLSNYGYI